MDPPWGGNMKHDKLNVSQQKSAGEQDPREDQQLILCLVPLKHQRIFPCYPYYVLAVNGFNSSCWGSTSVCCDSKPTEGETFIAPTVGLMQYTCNNNLRVMRTAFGGSFIVAGLLNEKRRGPIRCHKTLLNNQRLYIPAVRHVWGSLQWDHCWEAWFWGGLMCAIPAYNSRDCSSAPRAFPATCWALRARSIVRKQERLSSSPRTWVEGRLSGVILNVKQQMLDHVIAWNIVPFHCN